MHSAVFEDRILNAARTIKSTPYALAYLGRPRSVRSGGCSLWLQFVNLGKIDDRGWIVIGLIGHVKTA